LKKKKNTKNYKNMPRRIQRVNQLIKEEISQILLREIDFGKSFVTITDVDASANLIQAKIKISVMPQKNTLAVIKRLQRNVYDIQQQLNKKLKMRPVPKIKFVVDKISIQAQKVEDLLQKIKIEEKS